MNNLTSFRAIRILTRCEVSLLQGTSCAIYVDEPDDIAEWIDYHVDNGELIIQTKPMHYGFLLLNDSYPKIRVTCTDLNGIHVIDKAYVTTKNEFQVEKLSAIVENGQIVLNINAIATDITVIKRGSAKIRGNSLVSRIMVHQHGIYVGSELNASEVHVHLHGNSQATVWAEEELEANLFSKSKLRYKGNPGMRLLHIDEGCSIKPLINQVSNESSINQ